MCTAFVRRGKDVVMGFNFDVDEAVWPFRLYMNKNMFYVGIKLGSTTYKVHGVNSGGGFGCLPYMNGETKPTAPRGSRYKRLDLIDGAYISGKLTYEQLLETVSAYTVVNVPNASMHSLFADKEGHMLLVEPEMGHVEPDGKFAVVSNFSLLDTPKELSSVYYGAERYSAAVKILENSDDDFSARDGIALLDAVKQGEPWATRVSFVYSANENAVYYFENGDSSNLKKHAFA